MSLKPSPHTAPPPATEARTRVVAWQFGFNRETAFLLGGLAALTWSLGGGGLWSSRLWRRGDNEPKSARTGDARYLQRPDGSTLHVEFYGPVAGEPVVLTHGWGLDGEVWYYARQAVMTGSFHLCGH